MDKEKRNGHTEIKANDYTAIESSRKCINTTRVYGGMKMFKSITMQERLQKAEAENSALRAQLAQTTAQTAYVAMMGDVELPVALEEGSDDDE